jgi:NitT/TauT family transport system substrate-binding protein
MTIRLFTLALSALTFGVTGGYAFGETVTVRDSWTPSALSAGWECGIAKGLFKAQGIDIVHEDGNGSTTTVTLVAAKKFDIGWGDLSNMAIGRGKGMRVVSVMGLLRKTQLGIFVPAGSGIKTPKDLEGKTVLYTASSVEGPYLDAFFAAAGTSASKIDLLNVDSNAKISAYNAGQGMGVITTIPFGAPLINASRKSDTIEFADYGFVLPGYGMYVNEDTLKEKKETIRKVVHGMIESWKGIMAKGGAEECADLLIKQRPDAKLDRAQLIDQITQHIPYLYTVATKGKPLGYQAESDWAQTVKNLESAKLIPPGSKPTDYFINEFISQ